MNWTTKSGKVLDIDQMSSEHITNTIHYLEKRYEGSTVLDNTSPNSQFHDTYEQYQYMKRVLAERILEQYQLEVLQESNPVNPFQHL
jgi:hypothetical protein